MAERLLTPADVAAVLGLSRQGVYNLVFRKEIPAVKISRRCLRFRAADIAAWLESKSQGAQERGIAEIKTTVCSSSVGKKSDSNKSYIKNLVEKARKEAQKIR